MKKGTTSKKTVAKKTVSKTTTAKTASSTKAVKATSKSTAAKKATTTATKKISIQDKFLPIGTVVMLKGGTKRVMITGFCVSTADKKDEIWDYCGYTYPEGMLSATQTLLFDHKQITNVYHMGLIDKEETTFKKTLNEYLKSSH